MRATPLPLRIGERVEFASPQWLETARAFVEHAAAEHAHELRGRRFALCEVYGDAPPHRGFERNVAAFHIVLDDGNVTVAFGEIDGVDLKVRADFEAGQALVLSVDEGMPERRARVLRELRHRTGGNVFEFKGRLDPTFAGVLSGLHDHLARRTLVTTDLEHRITRLGLDPRVAELDEQGYTVLEGAFSPELADELSSEVRRLLAEQPPKTYGAGLLLSRGPLWEEIAVHPWVLALAEYLVGRGCTLGQTIAFSKGKGVDTHPLHTDYPLIAEPYPSYCMNATTIWALEDFTDTSGPTVIVPGSHRQNRPPPVGSEADAIKILMPKGSIAVWNGATWHGAAVREDDGARLTIHNTYLRVFARTFDCYLDIDDEVLRRNPPIVSTLCGLDDIFEKNTFAGPDYARVGRPRRMA